MLVIKRRPGERVVIAGGAVVVELIECNNGFCRLGFAADQTIVIDRAEIHERKLQQAKEVSDGIHESGQGAGKTPPDA